MWVVADFLSKVVVVKAWLMARKAVPLNSFFEFKKKNVFKYFFFKIKVSIADERLNNDQKLREESPLQF